MLRLERADGTRRVGVLSLVGLLLVPLVVAGGFLLATWNSTNRLDRVQAAVVNLDEPVTIGKQLVPLGRQLAGGLVNGDGTDQNFDWVLTDASDAANGLDSGRYAAVVTIPEEFSAHATSYSDQSGLTAQPATLDVKTSQVTGIADPVIGQAISAAATRALNDQLTKAYLNNIYLGFNETQKQFTKVADAADKLADGTDSLADGIGESADGTRQLADGIDQLDTSGAALAKGLRTYSNGVAQYADGVHTLAQGAAKLPSGARKLADGVQQSADGADQLASGTAALATGLKQYQTGLRSSAAEQAKVTAPAPPTQDDFTAALKKQPVPGGKAPTCADLNQNLGDEPLSAQQCQVVLASIGAAGTAGYTAGAVNGTKAATSVFEGYLPKVATYAGTQGAAKALDGAADGLDTKKNGQSLISGLSSLASGQAKAAAGFQKLADGTDTFADGLKPLVAGIDKLDTGAAGLASGAEKLSNGLTQYAGGVHATANGADQLSDGLAKLATGGDSLADGTRQLADGLAKGADAIPTYDTAARESLSETVAAPVTPPTTRSAFSNVATTSLLAVLALWVGALATFLVLRPVSARALSSMQPSWRLTLGSLLPGAVLAAVQSVVLGVALSALLDLDAGQTVRLMGFTLLAGLAFVAVNHALAAWFGGVGRFVSVVLLVLTVAGALTSAVPAFFDVVTPVLPLTPALQGIRAVATSGDGVGGHVGLLLAWLVVGLAAGVLATARHRTVRAASGLVPALAG